MTHVATAPDNLRGGLWMLLNSALFALSLVLIKIAAEKVPVPMVMLASVLVQGLAVWAMGWRDIRATLTRRTGHGRHIWRAALLMGSLYAGFLSVAMLPVAEATALSFLKPLFVTLLALLILREFVGPRRVMALGIGLSGIWVLATPAGVPLPAQGVGLGIASAALAAGGAIATRALARTESPVVLMMYQTAIGMIMFAPVAALNWVTPDAETLLVLVGIGLLSVLGNLAMILALRSGEASAVAPVDFTRAGFAIVAGWLFLSELPSPRALAGTGVIIVAAVLAIRR